LPPKLLTGFSVLTLLDECQEGYVTSEKQVPFIPKVFPQNKQRTKITNGKRLTQVLQENYHKNKGGVIHCRRISCNDK